MIKNKTKLFSLFTFLSLPSVSMAEADKISGGKAFSDAVGGITTSTPNLKATLLHSNSLDNLSSNYDNAPFLGQVFINISDFLNVSTTFTFALFWILGFFASIMGWVYLKNSIENSHDHNTSSYQRKFAISTIVFGVLLMSFNIVVLVFSDTIGAGSHANDTYNFTNSNVEKGRNSMIGRNNGNIQIDPTTGEVTIQNGN